MADHTKSLSYAVRFRIVGKYFGQLCLVLAAIKTVPLAVSAGCGDYPTTWRYLSVMGALGVLGAGLARLRATEQMQPNEGIVVVTLIFLTAPLWECWTMMGAGLRPTDAWFEAVSGVTTTGLSTLPTLKGLPASFLFARAWEQWYGGLGIVALSVALVVQPGLVAKRLSGSDVSEEDLAGGARTRARGVLVVYTIVTIVGAAVLLAMGLRLFDAVTYTLSAVSTGGFAPHDASLGALGAWYQQGAVIALCVVGAIPLAIYPKLYRQKGRFNLDTLQLGALLVAGLAVSAVLGVLMWAKQGATAAGAVQPALLLGFSAQTTAGFSTLNVSRLDAASKVVLLAAMVIGGGVGSTAGGFKLLRLLIVARVFQVMLRRTCLARHAVVVPRLAGHRLQEDEIRATLLLILLFGGAIALSWVPFVACGYDPLNSLFEVVSAIGTVGLSAGISRPDLPAALKHLLCADMLLGRLEIIAWLVLLYPRTWVGRRTGKT